MATITAIVNAHRERTLLGPSLNSLVEAADHARGQGIEVECLAVLDRPDPVTVAVAEAAVGRGVRNLVCDYGDPSLARNRAVQEAGGDYLAFLDGDDLWSFNWLAEALRVCEGSPETIVAHPEMNALFGNHSYYWEHVDSVDPGFDTSFLMVANCWTALSFANRRIYERYPYHGNDPSGGFAHEDWHWNCLTLAAGIAHRPVPGTVHFIRRRANSTSAKAHQSDAVVWPNPVSRFAFHR